MTKYKEEYTALNEKYSKLLSEKSELEYELAELKASAENIQKQDDEVRALHENIRCIKHDMKNHLMVNMQDIEKACNRLIIIDEGSKVYDGTLSGIREKYGTSRQLDVEFGCKESISPIDNVEIVELENNKKRFVFENKDVHIL